MEVKRVQPMGIELVRRGVVTEAEVNEAIEYQRTHRKLKIGEILRDITQCDPEILIREIADIMGEKGIYLTADRIDLTPEDYLSLDVMKECRAIPFEISQGKIKVCFSDSSNKSYIDKVRLILLNRGLVIDKYITFDQNIQDIIRLFEGNASEDINTNEDTVKLVDSIIKTAMSRRASDIHF